MPEVRELLIFLNHGYRLCHMHLHVQYLLPIERIGCLQPDRISHMQICSSISTAHHVLSHIHSTPSIALLFLKLDYTMFIVITSFHYYH